MGAFSPTVEEHVVDLEEIQAPKGFWARSSYKGKTIFYDSDDCVHMQYDYTFKIAKTWWRCSAI